MLMSSLGNDDVVHVAKLAKLDLTKKEVEKFKSQLSNVLGYVEELNKVDTEGIEPTSQTTGLLNVTRQDEVDSMKVLRVEDALSGTDKTHNDYFVVPAVIDKNS